MRRSKDVAIVILVSVLGFFDALTVGQLHFIFSGIPGANYMFILGAAILVSFSILMYGGRRWRWTLQGCLVALLFIPTYYGGMPFDVLARLPIVLNNFSGDVLFNSIYRYFDESDKLKYWAILSTFGLILIGILVRTLIYYLYYTPEFVNSFISVTLMLMPVIVIETVLGSLIGYKIYQRVIKIW
jgi:hypothetical protein